MIDGHGGNDTIRGLVAPTSSAERPARTSCWEAGRDKLLGGAGPDELIGGKGKAVLARGGRDTCRGGKGRDIRKGCERGRG